MNELETRLAGLEAAHRELAAQHTALQLVCRMALPLINAAPEKMRLRLLTAFDTNNALMDEAGFDTDYQSLVRRWMDTLSREILAETDTPLPRPSPAE